MLCRVRGFRVVVREYTEPPEVSCTGWKCYRNHNSSGYCSTDVQNLQKFRAGIKMLYQYAGYCGTVVQILQKFRVRVWMSYRTHRSFFHRYGCCIELTEIPGTGITLVNTRPRGRSPIWSGGFHPTCTVARSHSVNVPEAMRSYSELCGCNRQPPPRRWIVNVDEWRPGQQRTPEVA